MSYTPYPYLNISFDVYATSNAKEKVQNHRIENVNTGSNERLLIFKREYELACKFFGGTPDVECWQKFDIPEWKNCFSEFFRLAGFQLTVSDL